MSTPIGETDSHEYAAPGIYTISLTVTDENGLTDTTSQEVEVVAGPDVLTAEFDWVVQPFAGGYRVFLDATASIAGEFPPISLYHFDWSGGAFDTNTPISPPKQITAPTDFTLIVEDTEGNLSAPVTHRVPFVYSTAIPTASSTWAVVGDYTVRYDGSASAAVEPGATIVRWRWRLGDVNATQIITTTPFLEHQYSGSGSNTVWLNSIDDNRMMSDDFLMYVTVPKILPVAAMKIDPTGNAGGKTVYFDGSGSYPPDRIANYHWVYTPYLPPYDTNRSTPFFTTYTVEEIYEITLVVTDVDGLDSLEVSQYIEIPWYPVLVAAFSARSLPGNRFEIDFDASASSQTVGSYVVTYAWDFGDGDTGIGVTSSHTYEEGDWTVTLTASDSLGGTEQATEVISIDSILNALFTWHVSPVEVILGEMAVRVDGSESYSVDDTIPADGYQWSKPDNAIIPPTVTADISFPVGSTDLTLRVSDSQSAVSRPVVHAVVVPEPMFIKVVDLTIDASDTNFVAFEISGRMPIVRPDAVSPYEITLNGTKLQVYSSELDPVPILIELSDANATGDYWTVTTDLIEVVGGTDVLTGLAVHQDASDYIISRATCEYTAGLDPVWGMGGDRAWEDVDDGVTWENVTKRDLI